MTTAEILKARIEGKPGVHGATIVTRSGLHFDFIDPQPDQIALEDIAWGLARTCRFGGQIKQDWEIYSVADHSMRVALLLPMALQREGLMHDAAEAYTGDMVGPLKQLLPEFKVIEKRIEEVIAAKFGLTFPWPAEIKAADLRLLRTEQRDLTAGKDDGWSGLDGIEPLRRPINPIGVRRAAQEFMATALALGIQ